MAQEFKTEAEVLLRTPKEFQLVEEAHFTRRSLDNLYNPEITEYSVCVHTVANQQQCKDVIQAFNVCSMLIRIPLNFPDLAFRRVLASCDFAKALRVRASSDYEHAFRMGVTLRDRCTIFFLLSSLLPPMAYESSGSLSEGIEFALAKMGTSVQEVHSQSLAEADSIRTSIGSSKLRSIDLMATAGLNNLKSIPLLSQTLPMDKLDLPSVWLGDMTEVHPFRLSGGILKELSIDERFEELHRGEMWIKRFSEGCL